MVGMSRKFDTLEAAQAAMQALQTLGLNYSIRCRKENDSYSSTGAGLRYNGSLYSWTVTIEQSGDPWRMAGDGSATLRAELGEGEE